ncbi:MULTISPECIES: FCD domain-containing protein [Arthrobacter]|uniref:DNA-binding FadR family transcriptional regulator n=1 Tax=Arthrobacter bambusae TaxID=1338426 RepID=A0AAW8DHZ2_9MICC|nr:MULTISPECIES: FCD domain-containing protein [Arthrobacter]MDP9906030.1 DNA-binding FadR family transcriptional regulator [Arthrobacter bambusae]MDQ0131175.1 DNA-binding FadR family transcriptional regulator [Arthrobacter bambusae]MDQ0181833.1 DNA-binding FadR family transcriptional regulator [Arthrobacter bambusae]
MTIHDEEIHSFANVFANDPVSAALARLIRDLNPGDRLPSERELAIRLSVSRTALRDRLGVLEGLGVLRRQTGAGTFVEMLKPDALALALNLAIGSSHLPLTSLESVRIALERQAAREAAINSDPVLVAYMQRAVNTMASTDVQVDVMDADRAFHQSLLRAAGNPALTFFAEALSDVFTQDLAYRSARLSSARLTSSARALMVEHHRRIHDAIVNRDPSAAMQAVDDHFDALPVS